jgi:enolase
MIRNAKLYPHYNARGDPGLKAKVWTMKGFFSASVPAGASKGEHEARKIDFKKNFELFPSFVNNLIGLDETDWITADRMIMQSDGTSNFSRLGADMALAFSIAIARAGSDGELWRMEGPKSKVYFPYPLSNVIGGGMHGGKPAWQEFMVLPHRAKDPEEAMKTVTEIWKMIGEELEKKKILLGRNIENAWMCDLDETKTLSFLADIAADWGVRLGVDFAASSFWDGKSYVYRNMKRRMSPEEQLQHVADLARHYNIYYLEDPFHEEDFGMFAALQKMLSNRLVVGDDLYCTSEDRLTTGLRIRASRGMIMKPNQAGVLYKAFKAAETARQNGIAPVASHRSAETNDDWLADLALLWKSPIIKIGCLGFDQAKHNRLVELWHDVPNNVMAELP